MRGYKMTMLSVELSPHYNPANWTQEDLDEITTDRVVVGYMIKNKNKNVSVKPTINLYVIDKYGLDSKNNILKLADLRSAFLQWLDSMADTNTSTFMFRNPPLAEWLEARDNWMKMTVGKLMHYYGKTYDDCMSALHFVIVQLYNRGDIYIGNLYYITDAVHNKIRVEYRNNKNRLSGAHPLVTSLDASPDDNDFEGISSLHEIVGGTYNDHHYEDPAEPIAARMLEDLKKDFSQREIDQIINTPNQLPSSVYRRLLKWRKTHKLEDYL